MHTRAMRVLRGGAAAVFATFSAALSHFIAGGMLPSAFGVSVSLIISITVCTLLAGRTVSLLRLSIAMLASQAMYHTLFSAMLAPEGIAQHDMSAMTFTFTSAVQSADSVMSLAHVGAAIVTIVMFRYAEAALWGLLETARLFISRLFVTASPVSLPSHQQSAATETDSLVTLAARFLSTMRYRGPPTVIIAA